MKVKTLNFEKIKNEMKNENYLFVKDVLMYLYNQNLRILEIKISVVF